MALAAIASAQEPRFLNARVETRSVAQSLEAEIRALAASPPEPMWIAYTVPRVKAAGASCCYSDGWRGCALETGFPAAAPGAAPRPILLEGPRDTVVLLRVEKGQPMKLRSFSADCDLDAGGLRVLLLTSVDAARSIAWLRSLLGEKELQQSALRTLATHADASVDPVLEETSRNGPESLRRQAISSMAHLRGSPGFEGLMRLLNDARTPEQWRERAISSLAGNSDNRAGETIAAFARKDPSPSVRRSAVGALTRKWGAGAEKALLEAVDRDPDAGVRKRAVSALAQVPDHGGVPLLIQLARNPKLEYELRREAVRTLSRIKDPQATAFLEQLLK